MGAILLLLYIVVFCVETLSSWLRRVLMGRAALSRRGGHALLALGLAVLALCAATIDPPEITSGGLVICKGILGGLFQPDASLLFNLTEKGVPYLCLETLAMAVAGTALGAAVAVPLALIGSRAVS